MLAGDPFWKTSVSLCPLGVDGEVAFRPVKYGLNVTPLFTKMRLRNQATRRLPLCESGFSGVYHYREEQELPANVAVCSSIGSPTVLRWQGLLNINHQMKDTRNESAGQ